MKVNQSLFVKASILLVLTLSFIHAQYGIPFGGFGGMNPMGAQGGFGGAPYGSFGGLNPTGMGGLGGMGGNPFSFDQPYSSFPNNYGGNNFGQNPYSSGGYPGSGNYGGSTPQNQYNPNQGGFGQPNNNQNNMRLRFGGQIYGYNPFYYVANLVAVDLEYIQHFAQALTNTGFSGNNPFYNPISGMNLMGNQQQQQQQQPSNTGASTGTSGAASTGAATTGTGAATSGASSTSSQDSLKASQEALAVVFAKEAQIHITHLVKQQDSYGPKGVGTLTTQLVDSSDKLVTAANNKKWNDYQQEYNNLNNGLSKLSYYGMQQNMPSYPNFGPQQQGQQQQGQQQQGGDSSGNVKGSSFYPFLSNQGAFTMPQAPQAPQVPEMPQQFANLQQNLPKQFSFPDMPQMPQIPQVPQMQQLGQQQGAQQQQQTRSF